MPLPTPDALSLQHAERVRDQLEQRLAEKGRISFYEYMQFALYAPGLGYYSAGARKFGPDGDFITAPELSPVFSWCLARQCAEILEGLPEGVILELGAGSGVMAVEIMRYLAEHKMLPQRYYILEVSADLAERQRALFLAQAPELLPRVQWLTALPTQPIKGVVLANEVVDAMPVHRFRQNDQVEEFFVQLVQGELVWELVPADAALAARVAALPGPLPKGYCSEVNLALPAWLKALSACVDQGVLLFIDYGYSEQVYYHPERTMGTLMCHYRHHAHDDPFILCGIQDITSYVDFTALASSGVAAGFSVVGYVHQAGFLTNLGIASYHSGIPEDATQYRNLQNIKQLLLPHMMGERFKVLGLAKGPCNPLQGFLQFDQTHHL